MMLKIRALGEKLRTFLGEQAGAVLAETLIIVPFVTFFSVGILEFGNMFWQKQQVETGLRDAARYWARCQQSASFTANCSQTIARNIAFFSQPTVGTLRVPAWNPDEDTIDIVRTGDVIRASTTYTYGSPMLFAWLGIDITLNAYHEERYIGW